MILSLLIITIAFYWLMVETNYLTINLAHVKPEPIQNIERRKHSPRIELGEVKACSYPETKLLAEMCGFTKLQTQIVKEKWKSINADDFMNNPRCWASYQQIVIGGHTLTIKTTSSKLYDTIAEAVKVADSKPRKFVAKSPPLPLFVETVSIGSHRELDNNPIYKHPINRIVSDYTTIFHDCLCGKEWLEAHYNDHKDFEPTIELTVNEKSISFNGNYKAGVIHNFMVANAELWERPRIKGKKIKVEAN